ncbi:MAG: hypothetical protein VYC23_05965, partial [Chloroflexota bacterium]|nr:hypothetical protein [Chloroflexota bacterium]
MGHAQRYVIIRVNTLFSLIVYVIVFPFFQTTFAHRSRDSGLESVVSTHDDHGAPRHPSDYINTRKIKVSGGVSSSTNEPDAYPGAPYRPPPLPPKQWRRATNSDLFRPVQDEPVGEDQDEASGSGEQD